MEIRELLETYREDTDDEVPPYLVSTKRALKYFNEAMREAAVRARLMVESELPEVCQITLVPGQASYEIHPAVLIVRRAVLRSAPGDPLHRTTTAVLDQNGRDWRTQPGTPRCVVFDQQGSGKSMIVSPVPDVAGFIDLTVVREPTEAELFEEGDESAEPPFDERHHEKLVHWACFRALSVRDVEQGSTSYADRHLTLFEQHFGPMPSARELQQLSIDRTSGTTPQFF